MNAAEHGVLRAVAGRGAAQALVLAEVAAAADVEQQTTLDILRRLRDRGLITTENRQGRTYWWSWRDYSELVLRNG